MTDETTETQAPATTACPLVPAAVLALIEAAPCAACGYSIELRTKDAAHTAVRIGGAKPSGHLWCVTMSSGSWHDGYNAACAGSTLRTAFTAATGARARLKSAEATAERERAKRYRVASKKAYAERAAATLDAEAADLRALAIAIAAAWPKEPA